MSVHAEEPRALRLAPRISSILSRVLSRRTLIHRVLSRYSRNVRLVVHFIQRSAVDRIEAATFSFSLYLLFFLFLYKWKFSYRQSNPLFVSF